MSIKHLKNNIYICLTVEIVQLSLIIITESLFPRILGSFTKIDTNRPKTFNLSVKQC